MFPRPSTWATALLGVFVLAWTDAASADFVNLAATLTPLSGGLYRYTYTLTDVDLGTNTVPVAAFGLGADVEGLTSISAPTGWGVVLGTRGVVWQALGPSFDITPAQPGVFSFVSPIGPGQGLYTIQGTNNVVVMTTSGFTLSPGAVPEPASLAMLGIGLAVAAALARRGRPPRPA